MKHHAIALMHPYGMTSKMELQRNALHVLDKADGPHPSSTGRGKRVLGTEMIPTVTCGYNELVGRGIWTLEKT